MRLFFTIVIVLGWISFAFWFGSYTLESPGRSKMVTIEILPKSSLGEIGSLLKENRIIRESYFFRFYAIFTGNNNLKPGVYEIQPNDSLRDIVKKISQGRQDLVKIILPPGFTTLKLADRLHANGFDKTTFLTLMKQKKEKYLFEKEIPHLGERTYRLEGYLSPGSYYFKKDERMENIINEMVGRLDHFLRTHHIDKKVKENPLIPIGTTVDDVISIASLIEREALVKSELPIISGVIYNRMKNPENNKLMIDASIIYIYGLQDKNLKSVTQKLITTAKHPYNTYLHPGLPPGPISFPSKEAILAAVSPMQHDYEFYVTKKDGSNCHFFSKTYQEHVKNVERSFVNEKKKGKK